MFRHMRSRTCGSLKRAVNGSDRLLNPSKQVTRTRLAIIGAGIAGLAAAKTLEDAKFQDYLLIEAQSEVGGRIRSILWNNMWIEGGAQFVHGDQSELARLCYQHDLLSDRPCRDGQGIFLRHNGRKVREALVREVDDLVRTTLEECENYENKAVEKGRETIGAVLRNSLREHLSESNDSQALRGVKTEIFDWNVRFLTIDNACHSLDELSTKYWGQFKFTGGSEHLLFKTEYSALPKLIANSLTSGSLRLNTSVDLIEWQQTIGNNDSKSPLVLNTSDKAQIQADCVIITCSLGYLKENHKRIFHPPLPSSFSQGIECLGFGLINKVFLYFGVSWWNPRVKGFQLLWTDGIPCDKKLAPWTRDLTGFDVLPNHEGVLLGWVGGRGAYIVETLTEEQIAIDCENLLKRYLKCEKMYPVKSCSRTRWYANKYVRGSYSHITTRSDANGVTPRCLSEPIWGAVRDDSNGTSRNVPIIMFAGEATHESYYSTTHGAYETGVRQAQKFLKHHVLGETANR